MNKIILTNNFSNNYLKNNYLKFNEENTESSKPAKLPVVPLNYKYLKSIALLNFKGSKLPMLKESNKEQFNKEEQFIEEEQCNFVEDLFKNSADIDLPESNDNDENNYKILKPANKNEVTIYNLDGRVLAKIRKKPECSVLIGFKVGKCPPTIQVKDPATGIILLMTQGKICAEHFSINMHPEKDSISFNGKLYVLTGYRDDTVKKTVKDYFDKKLYTYAVNGIYADEISNNYSVVVVAGGYGTRMANLTSINKESKAAIPIPCRNRTIIHDIMDKNVGAGIINTDNPEYEFIFDKHLKDDGYIVGKSLRENIIPTDRPAIICPTDYISNIDFSKIIKEFEDKNAGIMLIASEISPKETSLYNLLTVNDDMEVDNFFVRRRDRSSSEFEYARNKEGKYKDKYIASLPIFIMHPKVLQELARFTDSDNNCKIGKNFMPAIKQKLNNNEILDDNNRPLKIYACFAESNTGDKAVFRDIGTFNDYVNTVRKIAKGEIPDISAHMVNQCRQNTDLETGVICLYDTKPDFDKFEENQKISKINGQIIVTREKSSK